MRLARALGLVFPEEEAIMPVWLEILLNLSGYAGFVALATSGAACARGSVEDETCVGKH